MTNRLKVYRSLKQMYKDYVGHWPAEMMTFEGRLYDLIDNRTENGVTIHLYHCADEQHYISVHLRYNLPFLIKSFYSVNEVKLANL